VTSLQQTSPALDDTLEQALRHPQMPPEVQRRAQDLLHRLRNTVKIVVLGAPRSGKSVVIDMLLGQRVLGVQAGIPIVEITYGAYETVRFETPDGTVEDQMGCLCDYEIKGEVLSVAQELPLESLKAHNIIEITVDGDMAHQQAIVQHAADYADVLIWCSGSFDTREQALWAQVPERRKDNSFLALTMVGPFGAREALPETLSRVAPVAETEFLGIYPVAALRDAEALDAGGGADANLWGTSGAGQLRKDVLQLVASGRAGDADQAAVLLQKIQTAPWFQQVEQPRPVAKEVASGTVLEQALDHLQHKTQAMLAETQDMDPRSAAVLAQCVEAAREMTNALCNTTEQGTGLTAARAAAEEGEEMLMLLQLEQDEEAATDAVTVLLQLKKELTSHAAGQEGGE